VNPTDLFFTERNLSNATYTFGKFFNGLFLLCVEEFLEEYAYTGGAQINSKQRNSFESRPKKNAGTKKN